MEPAFVDVLNQAASRSSCLPKRAATAVWKIEYLSEDGVLSASACPKTSNFGRSPYEAKRKKRRDLHSCSEALQSPSRTASVRNGQSALTRFVNYLAQIICSTILSGCSLFHSLLMGLHALRVLKLAFVRNHEGGPQFRYGTRLETLCDTQSFSALVPPAERTSFSLTSHGLS